MNIYVYFILVIQFVKFAYAGISDNETFQNLPIIYNFEENCLPNVDQNLNTCDSKVWLAVDGMRLFTGTYATLTASDINVCFKKCISSKNCFAITRRHQYPYCWNFVELQSNRTNKGYITYFLKCCQSKKQKTLNLNEKNTDLPTTKVPTEKSLTDSKNLPSYPVVSNLAEDCHAEENKQVANCDSKAWLAVDNFRIQINSDKKTETNIASCFQECLNSNQCKGVIQEKTGNQYCWIADGQIVNETNNEFKSFFLTCCALKQKKAIVENIKKGGAIVENNNKRALSVDDNKNPYDQGSSKSKGSSADCINFPSKERFFLMMMFIYLLDVIRDEMLL